MPRGYDILTDIPGKPGRFWGDHTTFIGPATPPRWLLGLLGRRWADNVTGTVAALRILWRRGRCQGVVTDGGASGILFALLQAMIPWGRRPHVMIDCNWYRSGNRMADWLKGLRLRWAARSVTKFVVWASHELEDYATAFGIPQKLLEYVPFHDTIQNYEYEIRNDGYIFAGGNYDRDYPMLIEAVRPLKIPTWIATTRPDQLAGIERPAHVRVAGTTAAGFRQAMAAARLIVVPMQAGLLHSGGQQTCLNGMLLGKPTIAVGRKWATDFIEDGVTGIIVDYQDPQGLQKAIRWVVDNPESALRMGERASEHAKAFTTERTMRAVYNLVHAPPENVSQCGHDRTRTLTEVRRYVTVSGNAN